MRGNLRKVQDGTRGEGPIPANAGEPSGIALLRSGNGAYPRECGGTGWGFGAVILLWGLSPRMRGNLLQRVA